LEGIEEDIKAGRLRGKMNELWALIGAVNASKEQMEGRREWAVVDEEGLQHITQVCVFNF
jgi:nuclear pore complex protein Nup54